MQDVWRAQAGSRRSGQWAAGEGRTTVGPGDQIWRANTSAAKDWKIDVKEN